MNHFIEFLVKHGAAVLFAAVFVEQIGVPLPALLWLFAAGALVGTGQMHWYVAVGASALGSVARRFDLVLSRAPLRQSCAGPALPHLLGAGYVRAPDPGYFLALRNREGLVVAKFIPGLNTLAPPLAGNSGFGLVRFLFYDGAGSLLYVGTLIVVGIVFSHQLEQIIAALASLGNGALAAGRRVGCALHRLQVCTRGNVYCANCAWRELRLTNCIKNRKRARSPMILDLRPRSELAQDPSQIRGALHMTMDEVQHRQQEIPRDRDIILYCSCPNEVSSARVALRLQRRGFSRVRPLQGGIDAWRERSYPTELPSN